MVEGDGVRLELLEITETLADTVGEGDGVELTDPVGVWDAEELIEREGDEVVDALDVGLLDDEPVGLPLLETPVDDDNVLVGLLDGKPLLLLDGDSVVLELGESMSFDLLLEILLVALTDPVGDDVALPEIDWEEETLELLEVVSVGEELELAVMDTLMEEDADAVPLDEELPEAEAVAEALAELEDDVEEPLLVGELLELGDALIETLAEEEGEAEELGEVEEESLPVMELLALGETLAEEEGDEEELREVEEESLPVGERLELGDALADAESELEELRERDTLGVALIEIETLTDGLSEYVCEGETLLDGDIVGEALPLGSA